MSFFKTKLVYSLLLFWYNHVSAAPTWPASTDLLEDMMFLTTGYKSPGFATAVTPCDFSSQGAGRIAAAEWIRTAFHDMAPGSVYTGKGGLDGSIAFELGGDNVGAAFATTLTTYAPFLTSRSSLADIIALGVYTAVRSCGGPAVAIKGGRKDATTSGPTGVPLPQNDIGTFINQFLRTGFNTSEMIAVTACGHSLGGVHSVDFPTIVTAGSFPNNYAKFDSTDAFGERVAVEYVNSNTTNPLAVGSCVASKRCSDKVVYSADGNVTIKALTNPTTFRSRCQTLLQKLIEVVPSGTTLSAAIVPYEVKPVGLSLSLAQYGASINFTGEIRVRTTTVAASSIASVALVYKDRTGIAAASPITASSVTGTASGFDDSFTFFGFAAQLNSTSSISSFTVVVTLTDGTTTTYNNNGAGFAVQDTVMLQTAQSCVGSTVDSNGNQNLTIVSTVRKGTPSPTVNLTLTLASPRPTASNVPVPALVTQSTLLMKSYAVGPYDIYSSTISVASALVATAKIAVTVGSASDSFRSTSELGSCTPLEIIQGYTYQGCKSDSVQARVLTSAYNAASTMTYATCASFCTGYTYFGVEYSQECYCGSTLATTSLSEPESDCSMSCGGNANAACGGSNRLNVFKTTTATSSRTPTIAGYIYAGCYTDSTSSRALSDSFKYDEAMTNEECASFCSGETYFGTEYGGECYCGTTLTSAQAADSDCNMNCKGSATESCGAGNRLTVYQKSS